MSETCYPSPETQEKWRQVFGQNVAAVIKSFLEITEGMEFKQQIAIDISFNIFAAGVSETMNPGSPINKEWKNYQGDSDEQKTT